MDSAKANAALKRAAEEKRSLMIAAAGIGVVLALAITLVKLSSKPAPNTPVVETAAEPSSPPPVEEETVTPAPEFPAFPTPESPAAPAAAASEAQAAQFTPLAARENGTWEGGPALPPPNR